MAPLAGRCVRGDAAKMVRDKRAVRGVRRGGARSFEVREQQLEKLLTVLLRPCF
jgi:hypothetical protein